jgi:4-hydroxythreonine-4-phosphate dehydrogenase
MQPLAVSMGDPAGVGLEVLCAALRDESASLPPLRIYADPKALAAAAARVGLATLPEIVPIPLAAPVVPGKPDVAHAPAVISAIEAATKACLKGAAAGLVTLPIAKAPLYAAGFAFPGHTEYVAHLTADAPMQGPRGPIMMLVGESLKAALVTIHTPLKEVSAALTSDRLERAARVTLWALRHDFAIAEPRLAVAGLNPHAGEEGGLGHEEIDVINPVAARLRAEGCAVTDALPADTLFHPGARTTYDAVLAMYHDQGLIPIKTLDFWGAVNVTLGLPIVRTSPDHGTAFAIAGKGQARTDSFIAAARLAWTMAQTRAEMR